MVADIFQVVDFGKGPQLHQAMRQIQAAGKGAVVFLNKTRHGGGLPDELNAYADMKRAEETGHFPQLDSKDRGIGAQILRRLGIKNIVLLSNSSQAQGMWGTDCTSNGWSRSPELRTGHPDLQLGTQKKPAHAGFLCG